MKRTKPTYYVEVRYFGLPWAAMPELATKSFDRARREYARLHLESRRGMGGERGRAPYIVRLRKERVTNDVIASAGRPKEYHQ